MVKQIVLIIVCFINVVFGGIRADAENDLFPISQNEKWGYIDRAGKSVITPQYDQAQEFSECLGAVLKDGKCGYIDQSGKMTIETQFISCENFSEGLAVIRTKMGGDYGYINKNGEVVIPAQFDGARQFSEGLAYVAITTGYPKEDGYIDKTGEFIIQFNPGSEVNDSANFSEGLAPIFINNQYGYIDRTGKVVIEPTFDMADSFSDGLANVGWRLPGVDVDAVNRAGYIDRTGELVIEPGFHYIPDHSHFSEGLAIAVDSKHGKAGFIDKTGKFVIEPRFDDVLPFSEGLAPVFIADRDSRAGETAKGKWGYVNQTGQFVIEPTFGPYDIMHLYDSEYLGKFKNGLAKINIGIYERMDTEEGRTTTQKWGYIDRSGRFVWQGEEFIFWPKNKRENHG